MTSLPSIDLQRSLAEQKIIAQQLYELAMTATGTSSKNRMAGPGGADGNYQITNQGAYLKSIAFARMMENNDPVVFSAGNRLVNNVNVGQMAPEPLTGSSDMNAKLQEDWQEYAANPELCDHGRRWDYETQADVTFRRVMFDGDLLAVPQDDATVLHLEGHRCQSPTYGKIDRGVCGVQYKNNRAHKYWLTKANPAYNQVVRVKDVEEVSAFNREGWPNVFHVYMPKMFTLNRGFSALGACGTIGARRDDLEFATVLKAQTANCITFIEHVDSSELLRTLLESGGLAIEDPNEDVGEVHHDVDSAGFAMETADIHPGRVLRAKLGRKLEMETPNIPGEGQLELNLLLIQYLAMCWDLPLAVLMLDARQANFTTFRGIMDQARDAFRKHQNWFAAGYHRPRYRNWLRVKAKEDRELQRFLQLEKSSELSKSKLFRHRWNAAAYKYYHPVDDAKGDLLQLANSMQTYDQYARKRFNLTGAQLRDRIVEFNTETYRKILQAKVALQKEFGEELRGLVINEHFLFPWPAMTGINLSLQGEPVQSEGEVQG